ncbi:aminotransferase class I/II-fold pyridoxal phosphate-dependent enzyme [Pseudonocardia sp. ICBG1142]|uniref:aminotransferase class I/II-fold pyridoxal phosphate-dependent enzyme n=1 Tax=Pseudonocardia sp. ICBG1142 TaxID=2846760 RepID=UPI001CF60667|nr:aminotransferase class I/II-fold pyridoxal phosphate-dependent enzyme [Pseudonocardia sp. ICBG1142]
MLACQWPDADVRAIMLTHPNNPTGLVTPPENLRSLAEHAARQGQTVIIDASFRGQVRDAQYDTYAVLDGAGADWIVLEDTGKLWPVHELKIGLLAWSEQCELPLQRAFSESMLGASPVVLQLVEALAGDWATGGYERARDLVEHNRTVVRETIATVGLALADPDSQISVARVELPDGGPDSSRLYQDLLAHGVHVLPCAPFYWADQASGLRFIRLSLARPTELVRIGAEGLARAYRDLTVPV